MKKLILLISFVALLSGCGPSSNSYQSNSGEETLMFIAEVLAGAASATYGNSSSYYPYTPSNTNTFSSFGSNYSSGFGVCNCKGYSGPGGPCYDGPGGAAYDGPGGPAYDGPGGPCYDGPGGPCYDGPGGGWNCPAVCSL